MYEVGGVPVLGDIHFDPSCGLGFIGEYSVIEKNAENIEILSKKIYIYM